MTGRPVQDIVTDALVAWAREQLAAGPSREVLLHLRGKLDREAGHAWADCPAFEELRLDVDTALAVSYGAPLSDLPGYELPGDLADLP